MRWILGIIVLLIYVAVAMIASYRFTCSFEMATALFAGTAVIAATLAYISQEQQRRSTHMETRRSQIWASFESMRAISEARRPEPNFVATLNAKLASIDPNGEDLKDRLFTALQAQWTVVEYWIVIGSWCNLMFTQEIEQMKDDRNAVATLLVGSLGSDHVAALVEYAARSKMSAFYPLIFLLWLYGGVREAYTKDSSDQPVLSAVDANIRAYASIRMNIPS